MGLICCLFKVGLLAQPDSRQAIDSLLAKIEKQADDTQKVNLLIEVCNWYRMTKPADGIKYGEQALELAGKLNPEKGRKGWAKGEGNAANNIAVNYAIAGNYPMALEYLFIALRKNEEIGNKFGMMSNSGNIGNIYNLLDEYPKALEFYLKSLKLADELNMKSGKSRTLANIGAVYIKMDELDKALEYLSQGQALAVELGDLVQQSVDLMQISEIYEKKNDYKTAFTLRFKALDYSRKLGDDNNLSINLGLIGDIYLSLYKINRNLTDFGLKARGQALSLAKSYTDSALVIQHDLGDFEHLYANYGRLSEIHETMGNFKEALEAHKLYSLYKDSVYSEEKDKKLTQIAMQYDFDKKTTEERARQEKKDAVQRNIRNSMMLGLAGTILFSFIVYRQRNKVNQARKRSDELLLNILPHNVAEELKSKGSSAARQYNHVSVLFTDFVNFTGISQDMSPTDLVAEIHKNFTAFDAIIEKHGLEKIKTIGDAYMAVCGLPEEKSDHAKRTILAALEIRDYIQSHNGKFEIRIGVHSGSVVAGIVGVKKYAYDIWGDAVNTASRIEGQSEPGKVNISEQTYELVKNDFDCQYRGKIKV